MGSGEVEKIINMIEGMTEEEQTAAASAIPSDILWNELIGRDQHNRDILSGICKLFS